MDFTRIKAVIFDMDGVLVNSEDHYKIIEGELFAEVGLHIDRAEHVSYQGCSNPVMWQMIKEKHPLAHSVEELVERTENKVIGFFTTLPGLVPMEGVIPFLEYLKTMGIRRVVASSSTIEVIEIVLRRTGLVSYFEAIVDCKEAGAGKPDPAIFLMALKKLALPAEACVVIEDSGNGIKAAKAAHIPCIAYNGPGSEHQDQSAADLRITEFRQLRQLWQTQADPSPRV
ncbi:MAG: HAD family phosphatase [Marinilabiliales bacterium]|nr:HAD family phosphatase [Marinilabiliales bacterium]